MSKALVQIKSRPFFIISVDGCLIDHSGLSYNDSLLAFIDRNKRQFSDIALVTDRNATRSKAILSANPDRKNMTLSAVAEKIKSLTSKKDDPIVSVENDILPHRGKAGSYYERFGDIERTASLKAKKAMPLEISDPELMAEDRALEVISPKEKQINRHGQVELCLAQSKIGGAPVIYLDNNPENVFEVSLGGSIAAVVDSEMGKGYNEQILGIVTSAANGSQDDKDLLKGNTINCQTFFAFFEKLKTSKILPADYTRGQFIDAMARERKLEGGHLHALSIAADSLKEIFTKQASNLRGAFEKSFPEVKRDISQPATASASQDDASLALARRLHQAEIDEKASRDLIQRMTEEDKAAGFQPVGAATLKRANDAKKMWQQN